MTAEQVERVLALMTLGFTVGRATEVVQKLAGGGRVEMLEGEMHVIVERVPVL